MRKWNGVGVASSCLLALGVSGLTASADLVLTDFNNTGFELSYGTWIPLGNSQTLTPNYVEISGAATSNGGAGFEPIQLDLSAYTDMVLDVRLATGNQANTFNLVLWDNDGTSAKYQFQTVALNGATFTSVYAPFASFSIDTAGGTPGLDLAHISEWDIEGDQVGAENFALQFDQVTVVPEPGVVSLGLLGLGLTRLISRRRD